ncbi:MAG: tetratricopeptide repeat protein [Elusimicrobia bacterium]|nr:tetratricopeptide repeat protein [Elusimicrobiota bacterium]
MRSQDRWISWSVAAATLIVFLPALRFQFVNFDDGKYILANARYLGFGWANLRWMFSTMTAGHYQPLSWLSYALDHSLWGMNPTGYHLTSVALHCANAALVYQVSLRLLRAASPEKSGSDIAAIQAAAAFAALVFAVHPLRAESVAWVTERRDVLSGFFFLATILFYLDDRPAASLTAYVLSLSAKGIGVSLPLVLLLLDLYPLRRLRRGQRGWNVWELCRGKLPYLVLAAASTAVGVYAMGHGDAIRRPTGALLWAARILYGAAFYARKTLLPSGLIPLYEIVPGESPLAPRYVLGALQVLALVSVVIVRRREWPALPIAFACYLALLLPVLGIVPFGTYLVADRYSYLACLSWAVLGAAILRIGAASPDGRRRAACLAAAAAFVCALAVQTRAQIMTWRDSEALWRHTLAVDPAHPLAHNNLGILLAGRGGYAEAAAHYRSAIAARPDYADARNNLAIALEQLGQAAAARDEYRRSLALRPDAEVDVNLALLLAAQGDAAQAETLYRDALRLDPGNVKAHNNLAIILLNQGKADEGIAHLREAIRLQPDYALPRRTLDWVLRRLGRRP